MGYMGGVTAGEIQVGRQCGSAETVTDNQNVTKSASATVNVDQDPNLTITKTAATTANDPADGSVVDHNGQPINYTITNPNTTNKTLTNVFLTDPMDPSAGHVVATSASLVVGAPPSFTFFFF